MLTPNGDPREEVMMAVGKVADVHRNVICQQTKDCERCQRRMCHRNINCNRAGEGGPVKSQVVRNHYWESN
jgi:hypothetical protein